MYIPVAQKWIKKEVAKLPNDSKKASFTNLQNFKYI